MFLVVDYDIVLFMVERSPISDVDKVEAVPQKVAKTIKILAPGKSPIGQVAAALSLAAELHSAIGQKPKTPNK